MKTVTPAQRRIFFREVRLAAREVGEETEAYRKRIMLEETGAQSLLLVSATNGFDRLMVRIATDKGDFDLALKYTANSLNRVVRLVVEAAKKIVEAKGGGDLCDYIHGVMLQSGMITEPKGATWRARLAFPEVYMDFTEAEVKRLLYMLTTHLQRLKKKAAS